jgi:hypothetical protein
MNAVACGIALEAEEVESCSKVASLTYRLSSARAIPHTYVRPWFVLIQCARRASLAGVLARMAHGALRGVVCNREIGACGAPTRGRVRYKMSRIFSGGRPMTALLPFTTIGRSSKIGALRIASTICSKLLSSLSLASA